MEKLIRFFQPFIIGHPSFENSLCWIDTDHALAGDFAAEHILSCGYEDVMFIGGQRSDAISNQRLKGFTRKMLNQKIHVSKERIIYTDSTRKGAYKAIMKLFNSDSTSKKTAPEAIVCENNLLLWG